jgi:hypothetical protein
MTSPEGLMIDFRVSTSHGRLRYMILKGFSPGTTKLNTPMVSSPSGAKGSGPRIRVCARSTPCHERAGEAISGTSFLRAVG